ncbi:hypothetical protein Lbys_1373 [Leadbetterella byssophila DSM 17132]|uniref:Uncharacterized protein n=1 Tax=Leadbetterella byssophila (strain DSM 17132 / JCM 16389 / KACC 11308 / NBRC 106382 / 4M15) TaxID=649349 RepID=E4RW56_LEAB4|nr:hypothetical protein [Leadbetterella byssophila]ADQ17091.1 hypothetical protein Lbys_1373 [Leadbetterella byssophila DSM 17132]
MTFLNKIDISKILTTHFSTIKNTNTGKPDKDDVLTFIVMPLLISISLIYYEIELNPEATNIIITSLSIFVGLMFNIIVLIFDIVKRDASRKVKNTVLKELLANISFAIILSVFSIIITLFTYISKPCVKVFFTWLVYFLLCHFCITLLMILKRMYNIFDKELEEIEKS